jgi:uncharacterized protein CbrC (UPF0167 family)
MRLRSGRRDFLDGNRSVGSRIVAMRPEFLGPMGKEQIERAGPEAVDVVRVESTYDATQWKSYYESLDAQRGPTAYLFKCRHCGKLGGYSDFH